MYPDLSNVSVFSAAGVTRAQYAINDRTTGLPLGPTGAIAQGDDRGMGVYIAVKRASSPIPGPRITPVTGDNGRFRHQYAFSAAELGNIDMNFGVFNQDVYAAFTGTKVHSIGEWNAIGIETDAAVNAAQATLLFNVDAQDANSGTDGQTAFLNWFYPAVTVTPLGATHEEVAAADWGWQGIPTRTSRYPWGLAYTTASNGFTRAKGIPLTSHYPMTMHMFVCDAATSTFTLDYSPTTDQTATGKTWRVFRYQSGGTVTDITATITSVVIATKTVTLASAYTAGDVIYFVYEAFDLLNS